VGENGYEGLTMIVQNPITEQSFDTTRLTNAFYRQQILHGGAGVGLWLCREILEAHHASLTLESEDFAFTARIQLSTQA
jgi:signal transduction histidine kinase